MYILPIYLHRFVWILQLFNIPMQYSQYFHGVQISWIKGLY